MAAVGALVDYERRTPGDRVVTDALLRPGFDAVRVYEDREWRLVESAARCLLPQEGFGACGQSY